MDNELIADLRDWAHQELEVTPDGAKILNQAADRIEALEGAAKAARELIEGLGHE
jgi:hypothetical protein